MLQKALEGFGRLWEALGRLWEALTYFRMLWEVFFEAWAMAQGFLCVVGLWP